jgi:hypothetical protein
MPSFLWENRNSHLLLMKRNLIIPTKSQIPISGKLPPHLHQPTLLIVTFCGNGNQATQVASETGQKYYMAVNNADPNTPTWESCRIFFFFYLF